MTFDDQACAVVFSGGQDSTTCLAWACARFARVSAVAIDYGQRHRIELECAARVAARAGVPLCVLPCDSFRALGGNALTGDEAVAEGVALATGLPNTFVPGRNLILITLVAAWAYVRGIPNLVAGVCQTDYSGYPDCRQTTMDALVAALRAGMDAPFTLHTPLMHLSKAESVRLLHGLGRLGWLADSHTCYNGQRPPCGACPACRLRARGFADAGLADPLLALPQDPR